MKPRRILPLILLIVLMAACENTSKKTSSSGPSNSAQTITAESSYCAGTKSVPGASVSITATGQFYRYNDSSTGLDSTATLNIRYAEVLILDSNRNMVQCGETDGTGAIGSTSDMSSGSHIVKSLSLPKTAGTYTLVINSRGDNNWVKASVVDSPINNRLYSISSTFTLIGNETGPVPLIMPTAPLKGTLEGGAFNILDQIVNANNYLRANTSCAFCTPFAIAPKVSIYWIPGFSPASYFGQPDSGTSFFNKSAAPGFPVGMYILGGMGGSVCTDTDHFDNSVIVHEYGHFMEYSFGQSDSPGGSHTGDDLIDPRLAWSEGWADFFQAAVLGRNFYRDTVGNSDCGNASLSFPDFTLYTQTPNQDIPMATSEGVFREFSTSRTLYKVANTYNFSFIWNSFSDITYGLKNPIFHFRNPGLFFQQLYYNVTNPSRANKAWTLSSTFSSEDQNLDQTAYGFPVVPRAAACDSTYGSVYSFFSGTPTGSGASGYSPQSNRYFQYKYDGTPAHSKVFMHYKGNVSAPYDLDLFAYQDGYVFGDPASLVSKSAGDYPEPGGTSTAPGYEMIDLSGKPAGSYILDVAVYTNYSTKDTTSFFLQTGTGEFLCP